MYHILYVAKYDALYYHTFMEKAQLIVAGCGHGRASLERAEAALQYHRRFGASKIFFTGGSWVLGRVGYEKSEATLMHDHVAKDMDCPVELDHDAGTTFDNFMNVLSSLDPQLAVGVVGHSDHMARLMFHAKKMLPNKDIFFVPVPNSRCTLRAWIAEAFLTELSRVWFTGASQKNLDHMQRRQDIATNGAKMMRNIWLSAQ